MRIQLYILVGLPLVGILTNAAPYLHLSGRVDAVGDRMDTRFASVDARLDLILREVADIDTRVSVLAHRAQR